jgi:hypothetical protein
MEIESSTLTGAEDLSAELQEDSLESEFRQD